MAANVLIVDDEPRYLRLLEANLQTEGHQVFTARDGEEALEIFSSNPVDLVLLDVMIPKMDGFATCQRIRQFSSVPIIMLTAKGEEQDRVRGLDLGADDYLIKPFSVLELLARVRAILRRSLAAKDAELDRYFTHDNLRINFARAEVWRDNQSISLSATEYRLLLYFVQHIGNVLSHEELLVNVWGPEYRTYKEVLWVTIARLRQKLEDNAHAPEHIITRPGLGYLMPRLKTEEDYLWKNQQRPY